MFVKKNENKGAVFRNKTSVNIVCDPDAMRTLHHRFGFPKSVTVN